MIQIYNSNMHLSLNFNWGRREYSRATSFLHYEHLIKGWVFWKGPRCSRCQMEAYGSLCKEVWSTYLGAWSGMNEGSEVKVEGDDN